MNLTTLSHVLTPASSTVEPLATAGLPSAASQADFAALLQNHTAIAQPDNALAAQSLLNQLSVSTELTAKVAGSLTQAVNKLVNIS